MGATVTIELDTDILTRHGYRIAIAWRAIQSSGGLHRGWISSEIWSNTPEALMGWQELLELKDDLVACRLVPSAQLLSNKLYLGALPATSNDYVLSRVGRLNLTQHGMSTRQINQALSEFRRQRLDSSETPGWTEADFIQYAIAWFYRTSARETKALLIPRNWQPARRTIEELEGEGIPASLIAERRPEFVLHWRDHGIPRYSYDATFMAFIRMLWGNTDESFTMTSNWRPSDETLASLRTILDNMQAELCLMEFRLYWSEAGGESTQEGWDSRFKAFAERYQENP